MSVSPNGCSAPTRRKRRETTAALDRARSTIRAGTAGGTTPRTRAASRRRALDRSIPSAGRKKGVVARVPHESEADVGQPDVRQLVLEDRLDRRLRVRDVVDVHLLDAVAEKTDPSRLGPLLEPDRQRLVATWRTPPPPCSSNNSGPQASIVLPNTRRRRTVSSSRFSLPLSRPWSAIADVATAEVRIADEEARPRARPTSRTRRPSPSDRGGASATCTVTALGRAVVPPDRRAQVSLTFENRPLR